MKTWSKTKNGLRFHYPSQRYYINAKRPGAKSPTSLCTGTNVESEAKAFYANWLAQAHEPGAAEAAEKVRNGLTLAPYLAHYRRFVGLQQLDAITSERKLRELTYIEERWQGWRKAALAAEDPRKLSVLDVLEFQNKVLLVAYAPAVAARFVRVLATILEFVEDEIRGFRSPFRHKSFERISCPRRSKVALPSKEQFAAVIAAIRNNKLNARRNESADLAEGLAYSNLRINEARQLLAKHVDLEGKQLVLPAEIVKGKRPGDISGEKAQDIARRLGIVSVGRVVPLGPAALTLFTRLVAEVGEDGRIFKIDSCRRTLAAACKQVGCARLSHHKLRHWWATIALEATGDAKQVAEWIGHLDGGKLVLGTYTHTRDEREKALAEKLDFDWSGPKAA